jgi:hypothetical protein
MFKAVSSSVPKRATTLPFWTLFLGTWAAAQGNSAPGLLPFGDLNGDGSANVADAQCGLLSVLASQVVGAPAPACLSGAGLLAADVNCDSAVSVSDVTLVIHAALGLPLPGPIDLGGNGVPDACDLALSPKPVNDVVNFADFEWPGSAPVPGSPSIGTGRVDMRGQPVRFISVLHNDTHPNDLPLTLSIHVEPTYGNARIVDNQYIRYEPDPGPEPPPGTVDSLVYSVTDPNGRMGTATVTLQHGDRQPVYSPLSVALPTDAATVANGEPLVLLTTSTPAPGTPGDFGTLDGASVIGGGSCGHYTQVVWSSTTVVGCGYLTTPPSGPPGYEPVPSSALAVGGSPGLAALVTLANGDHGSCTAEFTDSAATTPASGQIHFTSTSSSPVVNPATAWAGGCRVPGQGALGLSSAGTPGLHTATVPVTFDLELAGGGGGHWAGTVSHFGYRGTSRLEVQPLPGGPPGFSLAFVSAPAGSSPPFTASLTVDPAAMAAPLDPGRTPLAFPVRLTVGEGAAATVHDTTMTVILTDAPPVLPTLAEGDAPFVAASQGQPGGPIQTEVPAPFAGSGGEHLWISELALLRGRGSVAAVGAPAQTLGVRYQAHPEETYGDTIYVGYVATNGWSSTAGVMHFRLDDRPVAVPDLATTSRGTPVNIFPLNNDVDPRNEELLIELVAGTGDSSAWELVEDAGGQFVEFTPPPGAAPGDYSIQYRVKRKGYTGPVFEEWNSAAITVAVTNTPPTATNDSYTLHWDKVVAGASLDVVENDLDPDMDALWITEVNVPANAPFAVTISADQGSLYVATNGPNWIGTDTFTYTITDGVDQATATVTLSSTNTHRPTATVKVYTLHWRTQMAGIAVPLGTDTPSTDPDGDAVALSLGAPSAGSAQASVNASGLWELSFVMPEEFTEVVTIPYSLSDGAESDDDVITIHLIPPSATPLSTQVHWRTLASGVELDLWPAGIPPFEGAGLARATFGPGLMGHVVPNSTRVQVAAVDPAVSQGQLGLTAALALEGDLEVQLAGDITVLDAAMMAHVRHYHMKAWGHEPLSKTPTLPVRHLVQDPDPLDDAAARVVDVSSPDIAVQLDPVSQQVELLPMSALVESAQIAVTVCHERECATGTLVLTIDYEAPECEDTTVTVVCDAQGCDGAQVQCIGECPGLDVSRQVPCVGGSRGHRYNIFTSALGAAPSGSGLFGSLELSGDGKSLHYLPNNPSASTDDEFEVTVSDGLGTSSYYIKIQVRNHPTPVATLTRTGPEWDAGVTVTAGELAAALGLPAGIYTLPPFNPAIDATTSPFFDVEPSADGSSLNLARTNPKGYASIVRDFPALRDNSGEPVLIAGTDRFVVFVTVDQTIELDETIRVDVPLGTGGPYEIPASAFFSGLSSSSELAFESIEALSPGNFSLTNGGKTVVVNPMWEDHGTSDFAAIATVKNTMRFGETYEWMVAFSTGPNRPPKQYLHTVTIQSTAHSFDPLADETAPGSHSAYVSGLTVRSAGGLGTVSQGQGNTGGNEWNYVPNLDGADVVQDLLFAEGLYSPCAQFPAGVPCPSFALPRPFVRPIWVTRASSEQTLAGWKTVPCPIAGPMSFKLEGNNPFYLALPIDPSAPACGGGNLQVSCVEDGCTAVVEGNKIRVEPALDADTATVHWLWSGGAGGVSVRGVHVGDFKAAIVGDLGFGQDYFTTTNATALAPIGNDDSCTISISDCSDTEGTLCKAPPPGTTPTIDVSHQLRNGARYANGDLLVGSVSASTIRWPGNSEAAWVPTGGVAPVTSVPYVTSQTVATGLAEPQASALERSGGSIVFLSRPPTLHGSTYVDCAGLSFAGAYQEDLVAGRAHDPDGQPLGVVGLTSLSQALTVVLGNDGKTATFQVNQAVAPGTQLPFAFAVTDGEHTSEPQTAWLQVRHSGEVCVCEGPHCVRTLAAGREERPCVEDLLSGPAAPGSFSLNNSQNSLSISLSSSLNCTSGAAVVVPPAASGQAAEVPLQFTVMGASGAMAIEEVRLRFSADGVAAGLASLPPLTFTLPGDTYTTDEPLPAIPSIVDRRRPPLRMGRLVQATTGSGESQKAAFSARAFSHPSGQALLPGEGGFGQMDIVPAANNPPCCDPIEVAATSSGDLSVSTASLAQGGGHTTTKCMCYHLLVIPGPAEPPITVPVELAFTERTLAPPTATNTVPGAGTFCIDMAAAFGLSTADLGNFDVVAHSGPGQAEVDPITGCLNATLSPQDIEQLALGPGVSQSSDWLLAPIGGVQSYQAIQIKLVYK